MGSHKAEEKDTSVQNKIKLKKEKKKRKEERLLKKLKAETNVEEIENADSTADIENTEEREGGKRREISTLSIAVPGSILENAQSLELRTYLAGQIARAASIFKIDEIVVFDDLGSSNIVSTRENEIDSDGRPVRRCCQQLARILQYLECPQFLRKHFFPLHKDLQYAGLLNPLDAPHHLRQNEESPYREGVTVNQPIKGDKSCAVNCGLQYPVNVDRNLQPGIRVTVKFTQHKDSKKLHGVIVPPYLPRAESGIYWGYTVRVANSLGAVFSQSPYPKGYDLTIGTSERGDNVDKLPQGGLPKHHHAVVVFGGLQGLEIALENDDILKVEDPALLFDFYLNTCPDQGSRTIRTEEAILITLTELRTKLNPKF